jgi:CRP/FNR family transcriptional regulator, cyclic AMP receptor protein
MLRVGGTRRKSDVLPRMPLNLEERTSRLLEIPLFAVLTADEREALAGKLQSRRMRKNQAVFLQDDPGDEMYLLLQGRIKICCESLSGREITLCFLNDGGFFGEMALLDGDLRSATAFAETDGQLLVLRRSDFQTFLTEVPNAAVSLLAFISGRLRRANQTIQDLALLTVRERLAAVLLDFAEREGEPLPQQTGVLLPKAVSHKALAGLLATSRETISRMCSDFREQELIAQRGRQLVIINIEGLRRILSDAGVR